MVEWTDQAARRVTGLEQEAEISPLETPPQDRVSKL